MGEAPRLAGNGIATASPGRSYVEGCTCKAVLIDYVRRAVTHPYYACEHYGTTTPLDPHE